MNMRLLGARNLSEIVPEMVDASALSNHVGFTPPDNLFNSICEYFALDTSTKLIRFARPTIAAGSF